MRRSTIVVAVAAVASMTLPPAAMGAEGDPAPVTTVTAAVAPVTDGLQVTGNVTFQPYTLQVAEDPAGDATSTVPGELGTDITGATMTSNPAKPNDVNFAMQLESLPAGGIGEAVIYGWELTVDGTPPKGGTRGGLEWRRTNVSGLSASTSPFIRLRTCTPDTTTGGNTCSAGGQLPGAMDAATALLTATVRLRDLGGTPGSIVGSPSLSVYHGTGAYWLPGVTSDEAFADYEFTVPTRENSVRLALVPTGAAAPKTFPVAVTPSGTAADGAYSATVSTAGLAPGAYDLITQACWGGNCGEIRTPVSL